MVEHVVLIKPKPDVDPAAVSALWSGLGGLTRTIPGIEGLVVGENVSPEGLDKGYTLGFIVTFVDRAARDGYLPHPEHVAVVPLVHAVADDVLVFDIERS
ncbi:MAG: Dabb family protein [Thermomicrobiales bacterium]|nr:Dabb family protein [Thermomicrobiales bacterium]